MFVTTKTVMPRRRPTQAVRRRLATQGRRPEPSLTPAPSGGRLGRPWVPTWAVRGRECHAPYLTPPRRDALPAGTTRRAAPAHVLRGVRARDPKAEVTHVSSRGSAPQLPPTPHHY
ncbi:hypothetical protein E2C01_051845 [Portunus trituberculatus]|uniref:Uncharacterized protein n=1 Tax=Portunus trituberculatus TaxID=210409 RepID=A0A5B7GJY2_PORTR|nr:hypothetical protein [Portunus trituberculatus]